MTYVKKKKLKYLFYMGIHSLVEEAIQVVFRHVEKQIWHVHTERLQNLIRKMIWVELRSIVSVRKRKINEKSKTLGILTGEIPRADSRSNSCL